MAQTHGTAGGKMHRRTAYLRATASYTRPTDLAGVAALLATATKYGHFVGKTLKHSIKKGAIIELDSGTNFVQEYIANVEGSLMNSTPANIDDFNSTFDNVSIDVIVDDAVHKELKIYKAMIVHGEEDEVDGDKNLLNISGTKSAGTKAALMDSFSYFSFS